ncbi:MAG: hypothetical protein R3Y50_08095 [Rikenellaceae bacterium]
MESLIIFAIGALIMYRVSRVMRKSWDSDESEEESQDIHDKQDDELLDREEERAVFEQSNNVGGSKGQIPTSTRIPTPPPVPSMSRFSSEIMSRKYESIAENSFFSEEIVQEGSCSIAEDFDIRKAVIYSEILRPRWRDNEL